MFLLAAAGLKMWPKGAAGVHGHHVICQHVHLALVAALPLASELSALSQQGRLLQGMVYAWAWTCVCSHNALDGNRNAKLLVCFESCRLRP